MGLDLWFREDVARILASTQETMRASLGAVSRPGEGQAAARAYQQGFEDALRAVGMAFGLSGEGVRPTPSVRVVDAELVPLPVSRWDSGGRR
jgi:hypothetical protein